MKAITAHGRLVVPFAVSMLVALMLRASWHQIQHALLMLDAPVLLVEGLPAALEPAALIYAGVWIVRARVGGDVHVVRALFFVTATVALAYNAASVLPLDVLLPAGSAGRMAVLAVSAVLAPLTTVSMGHTALGEWAEWRASRRSFIDDVHRELEAEARKVLAEQLAGEFREKVRERVLAQMRADMGDRLGLESGRGGRRRQATATPVLSAQGVSANGHRSDGGGGGDGSAAQPAGGGDLVALIRADDKLGKLGPDVVEGVADAVADWFDKGNTLKTRGFKSHVARSLEDAGVESHRNGQRRADRVVELAGGVMTA